MKKTYAQQILDIIRAVLNNDTFSVDEVDFNALYALSKAHGLSGFVACRPEIMVKMPKELQAKFRYEFNISVAKETAQELSISKFLDQMEEKGLRCLPLKGFYIKKKYPIPALRQMTDTDILIDADKIQEIIPIMESLGLKYDHDTLHEVIFKNSQLVVELHKELIPSNLGKLYEYYKDGWSRAVLCADKKFVYKMSPEDTYIFAVNHIAKHYLHGGIGIKHVVDIFVMTKEEMDKNYIDTELSKLGIEGFHSTLLSVANMWFSLDEKEVYDEKTFKMAEFILGSGAFGNAENVMAAEFVRTKTEKVNAWAKIKSIRRKVFPGVKTMKLLYPAVRKYAVLYPIYIIIRIFDILFNRKREIKSVLTRINASQEKVDFFAAHCEKMGIPKDF